MVGAHGEERRSIMAKRADLATVSCERKIKELAIKEAIKRDQKIYEFLRDAITNEVNRGAK